MNTDHGFRLVFMTLSVGFVCLWTVRPVTARDCPELVGRWPYGQIGPVVVAGDYAYFGSGTALMVAEISNPSAPGVAGDVALPGLVEGVAVSDGYAYVADSEAGLRVVDVSKPFSPAEVGLAEIPGHASGVAVWGGHAYVAARYEGLRVIDVQTPTNPVEVSFVHTPGAAVAVAVVGGYAYVADDNAGLRVIDVSTASAPVEVGVLGSLYVGDIEVSGGYAYVTAWDAGLRVIDVRNPTHPVEVGSVDTPGSAVAVAVLGNYAYVADDFEGLRVIDVSTPSAPREVGHIYSTPVQAWGVAASNGHAYVADVNAGLRVVNVSSPSAPRQVGFLDTPGSASSIATSGGYAYVGGSGLRVLDVSTPSAPVEVGFLGSVGGNVGAISGGYAYLAAGYAGLLVVDLRNPSRPVEVGSVDTPGLATDVAVSGHYAYVADFLSGLQVIDVTSPHDPRPVGSVDTPGHALAVAVSGSHAYVADHFGGLRVIDVSRPWAPREVGFVQTDDSWDVAVSDGYAYVADNYSGLRIIDVSTPSAPFVVGSMTYHWARIWSVAVSEGIAYVVDRWLGLRVIDVETPSDPVEVGSYESAGDRENVAVSGGYVIFADGSAGVAIFNECTHDPAPDARVSFIPASALAAGAQGAFFQTDLELNNRGAEPAEVVLQWLPRGANNSDPEDFDPIALAPGESTRFENVLGELFGLGPDSFGALRLAASTEDVIGTSRTYNMPAGNAAGTFGQGLAAVRATEMIAGTETRRILFVSEDDGSRANVGCVNATGSPVGIDLTLYDSEGTLLETRTMQLAPYSNNQVNRVFEDYAPVNGYVDVSADREDALFTCYGSVLDNVTSDPTTILPQVPWSELTYIPAVALSAGLQGSFFTSDLELNNVATTDISYQMLWLPRGEDNSMPLRSATFTLASGAGVRYSNVVGEVFDLEPDQAGALAIEASGPGLLVMSRTYNTPPTTGAGTFGQELPGIAVDQMIPSGVKRRIIFMNETGDLRSNVGCLNAGRDPVTVKIELHESDGERLGTRSMELAALSNDQITRVFRSHAPVSAGYVDVWTDTPGAAIYCYGSVLDNLTSDPTTVLPQ